MVYKFHVTLLKQSSPILTLSYEGKRTCMKYIDVTQINKCVKEKGVHVLEIPNIACTREKI